MRVWSTQIPLPANAWLPFVLGALAPLVLAAVVVPLVRRRRRGIATVLAVRTVVLLGVGFAILAGVATTFVFRTGLRELRQRHEPALADLAVDLGRATLGLAGPEAQLRLALFRARDASVGFVVVGSDRCRKTCLVSTSETGPAAADVTAGLTRGWPLRPGADVAVDVGGRSYLLVAAPVPSGVDAAPTFVAAGIDAAYLVNQATRTAWVLFAISYLLLALVGWSSWRQIEHSLASRIHAITEQVRAGRVEEPLELSAVDGQELQELAESVSRYIEATLDEQKSSDERYRRIIELSPDGVLMCTATGIKFANPAAMTLAGAKSRYDIIGVPFERFVEFEGPAADRRAGGALRPARWKRIDGSVLHVEVAEIEGVGRESADVRQYLVRDVTDRRKREDALTHRAEHDSLTGLANRARFEGRLVHLLGRGEALAERVAVLFIDLDGFKPVNDRYGHAAGDAVLVAVAARLRESTRESDLIARLGGDEFAVLLEVEQEIEVHAVADRVLRSVRVPVPLGEAHLSVGASIGIATVRSADVNPVSLRSHDGVTAATELLRAADAAMYTAKQDGGGRYQAA